MAAGAALVAVFLWARLRPARRQPRGWRPGESALVVGPEARIGFAGEALVYPRGAGSQAVGLLSRLEAVTLRTTDQGPFVEDVFLLLDFDDRTWVVPSAHQDFMTVYDGLGERLPLNHQRFIEGMASAENNSFLLWGRTGPPDEEEE